jgi:hypothetical protein
LAVSKITSVRTVVMLRHRSSLVNELAEPAARTRAR